MQEVWVIASRLGLPMVILFIIGYLMQCKQKNRQAQEEKGQEEEG